MRLGGKKRTRHAGTALRAGVADYDDGFLVFGDFVALEGLDEEVFVVEDAGLAGEDGALLSGDLANAAARGEGTAKDLDVAGFLDGVGEGADDLLIGGEVGNLLEVLREGFTGDGYAGAVDDAFLEEEFEEGRGAADVVEVGHDVFTGGLEVGEEGGAVGDGLEVVDCELDADGVGNGDKVEDSVG